MRLRARLALATAPFVLLAGCGGSDGPANEPTEGTPTAASTDEVDETGADGEVEATDLVTGRTTPWGLVTFDDGSYLVGSRDTGEIALVAPDEPRTARTLTTLDVRHEGESGLLGLAASPDESTVLAYFSTDDDNRVVAMSWDGTALGEPEVIVEGIPGGATFHQGGGLAIGPDDGLLYVSTGDNGVPDNAQDPESLSGKVLRFTLDGRPAPDNTSGTAVFSLGHRNVEGLAFDDEGRLWASEFGEASFDELNLVEEGQNYGWPEVEGTGGGDDYTDPKAVWSTADASPSGLAFWDGSLWMAALRGESLWEIPLGADGTAQTPIARLAGQYGRLRNVAVAPDGGSLLLTTSNTDGRGEPTDDDDRILSVTR